MDLFNIKLQFSDEIKQKVTPELIEWLAKCERELNQEVNTVIKAKMLDHMLGIESKERP